MFKFIIFILATAVLISGEAYSQQAIKNQQAGTISGKVDKVDVEGGVIDVKIDNVVITFYFTAESDLYMSTHHMSSVEITRGDHVTIKYVSSSGRNNIISLVDNKR